MVTVENFVHSLRYQGPLLLTEVYMAPSLCLKAILSSFFNRVSEFSSLT